MFVAPGAVDCSVMQKSAGFLYFTLQMAWCGNNGGRVKATQLSLTSLKSGLLWD
jgi:hypothetical protein